jgi:hypothetical protein
MTRVSCCTQEAMLIGSPVSGRPQHVSGDNVCRLLVWSTCDKQACVMQHKPSAKGLPLGPTHKQTPGTPSPHQGSLARTDDQHPLAISDGGVSEALGMHLAALEQVSILQARAMGCHR